MEQRTQTLFVSLKIYSSVIEINICTLKIIHSQLKTVCVAAPLVWAWQHDAAACTTESNAVFPQHPPRLCPTSIGQRPTDLNHLKYTSHKHCNITPWKQLQNYVQQYDTKTYIDHWWWCYVSSSSTPTTQSVGTTVDTRITLSLEFEPRCIAKQNHVCLLKSIITTSW